MRIYTPEEAVRETVKRLKNKGFMVFSRSENSFYLIRRRCKVRVSNHHRVNIDDCDVEIIYRDPTILPDVEYRISKCQ
jgi:hypothetical protein